ncbi:hypothetical protein BB561_003701 [Smittium simulii]|uniref:Diphosphomevalonate decarboxylase n=1 Tax=Smittium simulii TaxID=133385 RepID=A0A2T9YJY2_9FUNG|nr:hypothetical protein BB561_003701 [Smittium simulii]
MDSTKRASIYTGKNEEYEASVTSPVNIAVIKYWGKRDSDLILPTNSSLSCTLSQDDLHTKTTIRASRLFEADRLWLNGVEEQVATSKRLSNCIAQARAFRKELETNSQVVETIATKERPLSEWKLHIISENNFPTAAGLASSASGYAALVQALANLFELTLDQTELSKISRLGSGSACRSMFGGFVEWRGGESPSGEDSYAYCVAPQSHWPSMHALVLVVSDDKKGTSSTSGMSTTVNTSTLFAERVKSIVPKRLQKIKEAILSHDFSTFAEITMQDSNQFHAVCMDTYPPIFYMNNTSKAIVHLVHLFNSQLHPETNAPKGIRAAYTFDAGPNAVIYAEEQHIKELVQLISYFFPPAKAQSFRAYFPDAYKIFESSDDHLDISTVCDEQLISDYKKSMVRFDPGSIRRIIHTRIGDGPRAISHTCGLANEIGMPKRAKD